MKIPVFNHQQAGANIAYLIFFYVLLSRKRYKILTSLYRLVLDKLTVSQLVQNYPVFAEPVP